MFRSQEIVKDVAFQWVNDHVKAFVRLSIWKDPFCHFLIKQWAYKINVKSYEHKDTAVFMDEDNEEYTLKIQNKILKTISMDVTYW